MTEPRKTTQLQIRLTPAQKAQLRRAAKQARMSVSAWVLARLLPSGQEQFRELVGEIREGVSRSHALAALSDFLEDLPPSAFAQALDTLRIEALSALDQNQIAAMVEHAACQKGVAPPCWVKEVLPLADPYFASDLRSLRLHLLTHSPPAFRRRNLFVDASVGDRI